MLQETQTEPPIVWSCNPLYFDFTQLFLPPRVSLKKKKTSLRVHTQVTHSIRITKHLLAD